MPSSTRIQGSVPELNVENWENRLRTLGLRLAAANLNDSAKRSFTMKPTRKIKAGEIVRDIRGGMSDDELMIKYRVSAKGLESAFKKLVDAKALSLGDLYNRNPSRDDTVSIDNPRELPRNFLAFPLQIFQADNTDLEGSINDITEKGLQVAGIPSSVGDVKEFLVRADDYSEIDPFVFQAVCRWANRGNGSKDSVAGYEITDISEGSLSQLRSVVTVLTLSG